jgi:hypothetical protein
MDDKMIMVGDRVTAPLAGRDQAATVIKDLGCHHGGDEQYFLVRGGEHHAHCVR